MKGNSSLSSNIRKDAIVTKPFVALWLALVLTVHCPILSMSHAGENVSQTPDKYDEITAAILNPFDATCYDWRGEIIPCDFRNAYGELLTSGLAPNHRFVDNRNGTVTDLLTGLVWLKNASCFKMMAWIVFFESGTTCYEDINNRAGYVWPVRKKE